MDHFDYEETSAIEFKEPADAVWALLEELYLSENAIDEKRIDDAFYHLCEAYKIENKKMYYGLQVKHFKEK